MILNFYDYYGLMGYWNLSKYHQKNEVLLVVVNLNEFLIINYYIIESIARKLYDREKNILLYYGDWRHKYK